MKKSNLLSLVCIISLFFFFSLNNVFGVVLNVATDGSDITGDGSPGYPFLTIQHAIDTAFVGDTIFVEDGLYAENIDFGGKDVVVMSINGPQNCTISGDGISDVVTFQSMESSTALLGGFTIINGYNLIRCINSSPTIEVCIIDGMVSNKGITLENSSPEIHHNKIWYC